MATIKNTISLQDRMTPVLRSIIKSTQSAITAMASMDNVSNRAFTQAKRDVEAATNALNEFNNQVEEVSSSSRGIASSFSGLKNPLMSLASLIYTVKAALQGLGNMEDAADSISLTKARLDLMNDGLQTTSELQDMIMASSNRARSNYAATASSVAKMGILAGDAFNSTKEIVYFSELMNKSFKIGGASIEEQTAGMYQLTQAMAAGKLQGDEFRSIMENAPMLAQAIAKYTGKSKGELKKLSADGAITADIIKAAMFNASDDINKQFEKMPVTFSSVMDRIKNEAVKKFQPLVDRVSSFLNGPKLDDFINSVSSGLGMLSTMASGALDAISGVYNFIVNNWSLLGPIIGTVAAAWLSYKVATMIATAGQWALNAAMTANPIGLVVAAIAVLIVALGLLWERNENVRTSVADFWSSNMKWSAKGVNVMIDAYNKLMDAQNWMSQNFIDFDHGVRQVWLGIVKTISGAVKAIISQFDFVVDNINTTIKMYNKLANAMGMKTIDTGTMSAKDINSAIDSKVSEYQNSILSAGSGLENTLRGLQGKHMDKIDIKAFNEVVDSYSKKIGNFTFEDLFNDLTDKLKGSTPKAKDYAFDPKDLSISGGYLDNVKKIDGDVTISEEDIKLLKDIAATEFVNKYTTLRPQMKVSFGDVHETADVKKIMSAMEDMVADAYASSLITEG
jgi:tape measure domain-containing protein